MQPATIINIALLLSRHLSISAMIYTMWAGGNFPEAPAQKRSGGLLGEESGLILGAAPLGRDNWFMR